jgi:hypothetical protein
MANKVAEYKASALDRGDCLRNVSATLPAGKIQRYTLPRRLRGSRADLGALGKRIIFSPCCESNTGPFVLQPIQYFQ